MRFKTPHVFIGNIVASLKIKPEFPNNVECLFFVSPLFYCNQSLPLNDNTEQNNSLTPNTKTWPMRRQEENGQKTWWTTIRSKCGDTTYNRFFRTIRTHSKPLCTSAAQLRYTYSCWPDKIIPLVDCFIAADYLSLYLHTSRIRVRDDFALLSQTSFFVFLSSNTLFSRKRLISMCAFISLSVYKYRVPKIWQIHSKSHVEQKKSKQKTRIFPSTAHVVIFVAKIDSEPSMNSLSGWSVYILNVAIFCFLEIAKWLINRQ